MDSTEFSPAERGRASAFVKAFNKGAEEQPKKPEVKPPVVKESIPKPTPKPSVVDPLIAEEETVPPKVNIGAEYTANKIEEQEFKALEEKSRAAGGNKAGATIVIIAILALSIYNFYSINEIKDQQERIINNEKVLFDKLARIGKRLRLR